MNKLGILIGFVVCFSLFSQIGFSANYDLTYLDINTYLNYTNETSQGNRYDVWGNSSYVFIVGGVAGVNPYHIAFYNWNGGFTGDYANLTPNLGPVNGIDWNGTHWGQSNLGDSSIFIHNTTWHNVQNIPTYANLETLGQIPPYWLGVDQISDKVYYHNYTGGNVTNITFGSNCTVPIGITSYDDRIYVMCYNTSSDILILRYNNNTNYDGFTLNLTDTYCNASVAPLGLFNLYSNIYVLCRANTSDYLFTFGIEGEYASGWGNITNDATDAIQNLLGLATHEEALMLFSVGWSAFFGLLAVMVVRRQVIILFTSIFMIGIMAFSWVGWLPSIFTWLFVIIAGLLVAMKVRGIWVGDG